MGMATGVSRESIAVLTTGVAAGVAGGNKPAWISGDVASLALSANVNVVFDLGPNWDQFAVIVLALSVQAPSSGGAMNLLGSDTTTGDAARRLRDITVAGVSGINAAAFTSAAGAQAISSKPMGRYVVASITNSDGANAFGATSKLTLAAYPS